MESFWIEHPYINSELEDIKDIMRTNVKCFQNDIEKGLLELIESGGKLLRPAFVILSSGFGEYEERKVKPLAAVIEMLHMSTLIHDDIVDDAKTRRGSVTVQSKYGKDYVVFMGDYLFSKCFMLLGQEISI